MSARIVAAALAVTTFSTFAAGRMNAQSPKVGDLAPDFTLKGSTKAGLLPTPLHLADFRGQVVVLAFFPKARTKG